MKGIHSDAFFHFRRCLQSSEFCEVLNTPHRYPLS